MVSSLDATGRDGRIQLALPISEQEIQALFGGQIQCERVLTWDPSREAASAQEVRRLDAIPLSTRPVPLLTNDPVTALLLARILRNPGEALNWSDATRQFQARVNLMRVLEPDAGWPDLTPDQLAQSLETWLGPWLTGKTRLDEVRALDLAAILATRLDREQRQRLEQEAPASLVTPAGARRTIDYLAGDIPVLPVPLQEMLGTRETPTIARGRVPLLVQLLSPAHRPIQLTRDLPGFWTGSYVQVRKEMRGRYPKHHWPEDPLNAVPMARSIKSKGA